MNYISYHCCAEGNACKAANCTAGDMCRNSFVKKEDETGDEEHIAVNMDRKKCGTFSPFRWLSPDIYHINMLRNPNEVDVHWGRSAKPKYTYL